MCRSTLSTLSVATLAGRGFASRGEVEQLLYLFSMCAMSVMLTPGSFAICPASFGVAHRHSAVRAKAIFASATLSDPNAGHGGLVLDIYAFVGI